VIQAELKAFDTSDVKSGAAASLPALSSARAWPVPIPFVDALACGDTQRALKPFARSLRLLALIVAALDRVHERFNAQRATYLDMIGAFPSSSFCCHVLTVRIVGGRLAAAQLFRKAGQLPLAMRAHDAALRCSRIACGFVTPASKQVLLHKWCSLGCDVHGMCSCCTFVAAASAARLSRCGSRTAFDELNL
jgi:hypothetical protein